MKRKNESDFEPKKKQCAHCPAKFTKKCNLDEHITNIHTKEFPYTCEECGVGFYRHTLLQKHKEKHHKSLTCEVCGHQVLGYINFNKHLKLHEKEKKLHEKEKKVRKEKKVTARFEPSDEIPEFSEENEDITTESGFNKMLSKKSWRIRGARDPLTLMNKYRPMLKHYLTSLLIKSAQKCYIIMEITFVKKNKDGLQARNTAYFRSFTRTLLRSTQINDFLDESTEKIDLSFDQYLQNGSGWILETIDYLNVCSADYVPVRGKSYIPTPKSLGGKHAIVNIKNEDERCFEYAIIASQHYQEIDQKNASRPAQYTKWLGKFNFKDCQQPMQLDDVDKFEKNNQMGINIFHIKADGQLISPLRITQQDMKLEEYINLLLIEGEDRCHYTWIRNLDRLLCYDKKHSKKFCPFCCYGFDKRAKKYKETLAEHLLICRKYGGQKVIIPSKGKNYVEFKELSKW